MRKLLFPFSIIYYFVTASRNWFFDKGIFTSKSFSTKSIGIGNLSTGGTGKSPMIMYLIELLKNDYSLATISRGYGRSTKGFKIANDKSTHEEIGDEPLMFSNRFKEITVTVGEKRVDAFEKVEKELSPDVVLLDDVFQHRYVKAGFYILLTDFSQPYFNDHLLPAGNLRESRWGAQRADIIIVTKCPPELSEEDKTRFREKLKPKKHQQVYFSSIGYGGEIIGSKSRIPVETLAKKNILLITGIAKADLFKHEVEKHSAHFEHISFKDHHNFSGADVEMILKQFENIEGEKLLLTTEKDYMRLKAYPELLEDLFYWPIEVEIENKKAFDKHIFSYASKQN